MIYKNSAVFDFETTGLDRNKDTMIEVAAIRIRNGHVVGSYHELVNPGHPLPAEITNLTGVTDEMVANCAVIFRTTRYVGGGALRGIPHG